IPLVNVSETSGDFLLVTVPETNQHEKHKAGNRKNGQRKQDSADRSCHGTNLNRNRSTAIVVMFCVDCAVGSGTYCLRAACLMSQRPNHPLTAGPNGPCWPFPVPAYLT